MVFELEVGFTIESFVSVVVSELVVVEYVGDVGDVGDVVVVVLVSVVDSGSIKTVLVFVDVSD